MAHPGLKEQLSSGWRVCAIRLGQKSYSGQRRNSTVSAMTDVFSRSKRSWVMSRIRGTHTTPEIVVRRFLHVRGFRFRLHVRLLPGCPDVVLPRYRLAVFVLWRSTKDQNSEQHSASCRRLWVYAPRLLTGITTRDGRFQASSSENKASTGSSPGAWPRLSGPTVPTGSP